MLRISKALHLSGCLCRKLSDSWKTRPRYTLCYHAAAFLRSCFTSPPPPHQPVSRVIGRIEKDWNLQQIEKKIEESSRPFVSRDRDPVLRWNRDAFDDKVRDLPSRPPVRPPALPADVHGMNHEATDGRAILEDEWLFSEGWENDTVN